MSKPDPTKALFAFFDDDNSVSFVSGKRFAELPDREKLEVINIAVEMLMEQSSNIITSLKTQQIAATGHWKIH